MRNEFLLYDLRHPKEFLLLPKNNYPSYTPTSESEDKKMRDDLYVLNNVLSSKLGVNARNSNGMSALHIAAKYKQFDKFKDLVDLGIDTTFEGICNKDRYNKHFTDYMPSNSPVISEIKEYSKKKLLQNISLRAYALYESLALYSYQIPYELCYYIAELEGGGGPKIKVKCSSKEDSLFEQIKGKIFIFANTFSFCSKFSNSTPTKFKD